MNGPVAIDHLRRAHTGPVNLTMADVEETTVIEDTAAHQPANDQAEDYDGLDSPREDDADSIAQFDDELRSEVAEEDVRNIAAEVAEKYVRPGGIVSVSKSTVHPTLSYPIVQLVSVWQ